MTPLTDAAFFKKTTVGDRHDFFARLDQLDAANATLASLNATPMSQVEINSLYPSLASVLRDSRGLNQDETTALAFVETSWTRLELYNYESNQGNIVLVAPVVRVYTRMDPPDPFDLVAHYLMPVAASYVIAGEEFDESNIPLIDIGSLFAGNEIFVSSGVMFDKEDEQMILFTTTHAERVPIEDEENARFAAELGEPIYSRNERYASLGFNPYLAITTESSTLYTMQLMREERKQTRLLLINLVATLIASDGVRLMVQQHATNAGWSQEDLVNNYTGTLASLTANLLTAMGALTSADDEDVRTVAYAIAGYVYQLAVATGWRLPGGLSLQELQDSDLGKRLSREVPAQVALMQRDLAEAVSTFVSDARKARQAAEASSAIATTGAVVSAAKLLI